ncbi:histidine phosphatase family protein [Tundrisphaera sp. TA3]|uniref:histidine phosphatase family protein n=1 Tax=Tundrisphaera sp. TA3 TaxID=3435775 RepID=UPI003EBE6828
MQDPTTSRVLLLRHAETAAPDRFHGAESDVALGPRGHLQAEAAATALRDSGIPIAAVYSSGMLRARETAAPIAAALGLDTAVVPELHERRMGSLSGRPLAEGWDDYQAAMALWKADDLDATHQGGESYAQIRDRAVPALAAIADRHRGQAVVVVAHGVVIRVLLTALLEGSGPVEFDRYGIDFVAVNDLRWDGRTWRAARLNGHEVAPG